MDNTIKINLINNKVICILNITGEIFGQDFSSRKQALDVYFKETAHLDELGILDPTSSILN